MAKNKRQPKTFWGRAWHFIWYEDSMASWLVNIILAFIIIKFILYPFLSLVLGTSLPLVAVVSESMDHGYTKVQCREEYSLCGDATREDVRTRFPQYWEVCGKWYDDNGISDELFRTFTFRNGFSKGDIIVLSGKEAEDINIGDVIVFYSRAEEPRKPYPIIHRVVDKELVDGDYIFETKGDHNEEQIRPPFDTMLDETNVHEDLIIGVARMRIPWLGWVKVGLVDMFTGSRC